MSEVPWSLHVCCDTRMATPHGGAVVGLSKRGDPFKDSSATQHFLTSGGVSSPDPHPKPTNHYVYVLLQNTFSDPSFQ